MATVIDNSVAFALKKTLDIFKVKVIYFFTQGIESYVFATVMGQIVGGLLVCVMNYRWTFKAKEIKFRYILMRFVFVWLCSIVLNTFFTFKLTELLRGTPLLVHLLGRNSDDIFIVVKLTVALIVGLIWNYTMYRLFVYRNIDFREFSRKIFKKKNNI
ncbi:CDP-alcohol phosphatidyltransferase [Bacteroidia bacterium]|nr:CDP-alcohol phosphatidyltransferase [Bacteroidia bacterium]GHV44816.1 CDP-alcohol phosphatidyltransferase [Bacteroidia bacterium]